MFINSVALAFSLILALALGIAAGYKLAPRTTSGPATAAPKITLGGPLGSVIENVNGKVTTADGKSLTIEANGQSITIKMGGEVALIQPPPTTTPAKPASVPPVGSSSAQENLLPNFDRIPLGSQISAVLEMQPDGTFLTKSVFLIAKTANP